MFLKKSKYKNKMKNLQVQGNRLVFLRQNSFKTSYIEVKQQLKLIHQVCYQNDLLKWKTTVDLLKLNI